ncbi:MAG: hypothetical protein FIB05_07150, partial [Betaproteobacteria bacterium]|nr:hypothetical protein [Betaproteobacteria bacterium]
MPAPIASERHRRPPARILSLPLHAIGCLAVALLALARPDDLHAQVTSIDVGKAIAYEQVSASSVVPASLPYVFEAGVRGSNLESLSPVPTLSGPAFSGPLTYRSELAFPSWTVWEFFSDQAALEARAPSGTYTITVNGTPVPLQVAGDLYPNPPLLTLSGGTWSGGKYVFDPGRPLTITTNAFADYARFKGVIFLGGSQQFAVNNPANSMSVTIPAGTYAAGQEISLNAQFTSFTHENLTALPGIYAAATYAARTRVRLVAQPQSPPVFEMTVRTNITPAAASASADIQFRPQDVGTSGSVYAFAVAPQGVLKAAGGEAPLVVRKSVPANGKDTPVACVLAQLNASGQLQAVSASQLQAYVTGVLSAQGQAVTILDNVPTTNVAGATFYVGYGTSGEAMINSGVNRSAVTVPGTQTCQPQPPQTGWWWNAAEDGRGYTIESTGSKIFFAAYLYDISGRSTWYIAAGPTS